MINLAAVFVRGTLLVMIYPNIVKKYEYIERNISVIICGDGIIQTKTKPKYISINPSSDTITLRFQGV